MQELPQKNLIKRTLREREAEKELFDMVYHWGKYGIETDELCNAFQDKLEEIIYLATKN